MLNLTWLIAASPDFIAAEHDADDTKTANSAVVHVASAAWPEPLSLPEGLSPVENFDLEFIPPAIGPWVGDISERMQCPPEYIAVSAMVGLGSVLGRKIAIRPQRKTDWLEVANLWGCVVGRPGMMKSPAMMEALRPLYRLETMAREAYGIEAARYAQDLEVHKLRREAAEKSAREALRKNVMASIEAGPLAPEQPKERRYIANDVTYEKLGEILADNPNGVLAHRDELVSLLKTLDREEYAPAPRILSDRMERYAGLHLRQGHKGQDARRGRLSKRAGLDSAWPARGICPQSHKRRGRRRRANSTLRAAGLARSDADLEECGSVSGRRCETSCLADF